MGDTHLRHSLPYQKSYVTLKISMRAKIVWSSSGTLLPPLSSYPDCLSVRNIIDY